MLLKLCYSIKKLGKDPSSFISSLADRENYCERNERTVSQCLQFSRSAVTMQNWREQLVCERETFG